MIGPNENGKGAVARTNESMAPRRPNRFCHNIDHVCPAQLVLAHEKPQIFPLAQTALYPPQTILASAYLSRCVTPLEGI